MQSFLHERQAEIAKICRRHHVIRLEAFGSVVHGDFRPEHSDVAFLVEFGPMPFESYAVNKLHLKEELVHLLHRDVDLVVSKYVRNPYFLRQVDAENELLYAA